MISPAAVRMSIRSEALTKAAERWGITDLGVVLLHMLNTKVGVALFDFEVLEGVFALPPGKASTWKIAEYIGTDDTQAVDLAVGRLILASHVYAHIVDGVLLYVTGTQSGRRAFAKWSQGVVF